MIGQNIPAPPAAAGIGGSTGSVDNAILRADGTGGSTLQSSGLIVDDAVVAYSVTGDASTDVITATGHIYTANQTVIFSGLTGGSGLSNGTLYFVRDISGSTFRVSTTSGGAAVNFTTNITAGSVIAIQANVAISQNTTETNSALVLTPKGTGAFILGPKPDGTTTGGNARGTGAVDLQISRAVNTQIATGNNSVALGTNNTALREHCVAIGFQNQANATSGAGYAIAIGRENQANSGQAVAIGYTAVASGNGSFVGGGQNNEASANYSGSFGFLAKADRYGMQAIAAGRFGGSGVVGDAQRARFVLRCKTTTNAAVEMALDGGSTYLTIPSGKVMFMNIKVVGTKSDGTAVATYERQYAVKNVAGTSSQVYAPITIGTDNAVGTTIEVATVDAGDYVRIRPTGIASETWRWVASVDAVEVAYGA